MKTFIAQMISLFIFECPHCGMMHETDKDPEEEPFFTCDCCEKDSACELVEWEV
jgi:hypothetical protein